MTIPILGSSIGSGGRTVCVVCGGNVSDPDHKHIYTDVKLLNFYDELCKNLLLNGCMVIDPENGTIFWGHPPLKEGYVWAPTPIEVALKKPADPYANNPNRCLVHKDAQHEIGECGDTNQSEV